MQTGSGLAIRQNVQYLPPSFAADLPVRDLRRVPVVCDGRHHWYLVTDPRLPGSGESEQAAGRSAREPVVALRCWLSGLQLGAQLRKVA
jgi:hypothetical protein